jgi:hypothetical protein
MPTRSSLKRKSTEDAAAAPPPPPAAVAAAADDTAAIRRQGVRFVLFKRIGQMVSESDTCFHNVGVSKLILDWCQPHNCSLVELLERYHKEQPHPLLNLTYAEAVTDQATRFVSYVRRTSFHDIVGVLESHGNEQNEEDVSFWFDLFLCNQLKSDDTPGDVWARVFKENILRINHTIVILSPWERPLYFDRTWCIWEFYCSVLMNVNLAVCFTQADLYDLKSRTLHCNKMKSTESALTLLQTSSANPEKLHVALNDFRLLNDLILTIDVEKSQIYNDEASKRNILAAISSTMSLKDFNSIIQNYFRKEIFSRLTSTALSKCGVKRNMLVRIKQLTQSRPSWTCKNFLDEFLKKELMQGAECSLPELMKRNYQTEVHPVLKLTHSQAFTDDISTAITHSLDTNLSDTLDAILEDSIVKPQESYWWDLILRNHFELDNLDGRLFADVEMTTIERSIQDRRVLNGVIKRTLLLPLPWDKPIMFGRTWPMVEVFFAHKCNSILDLGFNARDLMNVKDSLQSGNSCTLLENYTVDFMGTSTTHRMDKESILYALYDMGANAQLIDDDFSAISEILKTKLERVLGVEVEVLAM